MRYVVTGEEMKRADAYTMEQIGLLSPVLMERAALSVTERLMSGDYDLKHVLVVCGIGNNGGDGLAVARMLFLKHMDVHIYMAGDIQKGSDEAKRQYRIAQFYHIPEVTAIDDIEYTTVVDAIFGVGLSRDVAGAYAEIISCINQMKAKVLAVDISSGIHTDTGKVCGIAVKADETVTFAFEKAGQLLYPGAAYSGKVTIADIGITEASLAGQLPTTYVYEEGDIQRIAPRVTRSNKGTYGKVLVIAGSKGMAGAAYFSAAAAYRSGCGLVKIYTDICNREILQTLLPEAMMSFYDEKLNTQNLAECLDWADAVVFGPGVGIDAFSEELLAFVLENCRKPLILDADGITMVSGNPRLWEKRPQVCILTPHPGEMARLLDCSVQEIAENISDSARSCAQRYQAVSVLKDAATVIAAPDGRCAVNTTGNNGMSTGGSGDVLTGVIAAFCARKADPFEAAAVGVYAHGAAGDRAAKELGQRNMLAGDIIRYL